MSYSVILYNDLLSTLTIASDIISNQLAYISDPANNVSSAQGLEIIQNSHGCLCTILADQSRYSVELVTSTEYVPDNLDYLGSEEYKSKYHFANGYFRSDEFTRSRHLKESLLDKLVDFRKQGIINNNSYTRGGTLRLSKGQFNDPSKA